MFNEAWDDQEPFNLILLDIQMPIMNGHETLQAIRENEREREIPRGIGVPVLITTNHDTSQDIIAAFGNGCQGYLKKPIDEDALLHKLTELELLNNEASIEE